MTARWLRSLRRLLGGDPPPEGFDGRLTADERVLATAPVAGGHLVATTLGLWVPDADGGDGRANQDGAAGGAGGDGQDGMDAGGRDGAAAGLDCTAGRDQGRHRLIGWHRVSKATWNGRVLTVIEADEVGREGDAVLIADREPRRYALPEPARVPELVHARVTRSVLYSERAPAGDLVVRRRVPGQDGVQVQIRRAAP